MKYLLTFINRTEIPWREKTNANDWADCHKNQSLYEQRSVQWLKQQQENDQSFHSLSLFLKSRQVYAHTIRKAFSLFALEDFPILFLFAHFLSIEKKKKRDEITVNT